MIMINFCEKTKLVENYKNDMPKRVIIKDIEKCVGCGLCMYACARRNGEIGNDSSGILAVSLSGFERGATVIFCRACKEPPCAQVCPTNALVPRKGGGVVFREDLCIGCKNCMEACTIGAIFERSDGKPALCIHCGYCVKFCPHGVLGYEEVEA
jgi:Fe-S-cluster-containing dehydrogenase component